MPEQAMKSGGEPCNYSADQEILFLTNFPEVGLRCQRRENAPNRRITKKSTAYWNCLKLGESISLPANFVVLLCWKKRSEALDKLINHQN
jgi:hypothetical protein